MFFVIPTGYLSLTILSAALAVVALTVIVFRLPSFSLIAMSQVFIGIMSVEFVYHIVKTSQPFWIS